VPNLIPPEFPESAIPAGFRQESVGDSKVLGSTLSHPPPPSPISFWVDASTDWGIGIIFDGHWEVIKFVDGWKSGGRNIGWAEFIAIELGLLRAIAQGHCDKHFVIHSDNQGIIQAIRGGKSRSPEQNLV
jgi:hypothetical protein